MVLAGYVVRASNSVKEFQVFLKKYNLPAITTQFSKDIIEYDSKFFIGHTGPKGDRAGNNIAQQADFILIIGCSLHPQTIGWEKELFAPKAKKIQIDADKEVLKKDIPNINFKYNIYHSNIDYWTYMSMYWLECFLKKKLKSRDFDFFKIFNY